MSNDRRLGMDPLDRLRPARDKTTPRQQRPRPVDFGLVGHATWDPTEVLERTTQPFCVVGINGLVLYMNAALAGLLGRASGEAPRWREDMLAPGSLDQDQELASAMAQTGQDVAYECRLQHLDGREIPIRVSRSAGMAADGTVKYHFMFIRPLEAEQTGPRTASAGTGPGVIRPIKPSEGAPVMSKNKVKLDTAITLPQAIAKLEELIDSLKQGTVNFQVGEEAVTVVPPDILHLEMKVAQKKEKERIKLELSWERSEEAAATGESSISSDPRIEMP